MFFGTMCFLGDFLAPPTLGKDWIPIILTQVVFQQFEQSAKGCELEFVDIK